MITTIVTFRLREKKSVAEARALFQGTAPRYQSQPGLIRKYYFLAEDGLSAGGIYLWKARADAEALYDDAWRAFVTDKYGVPPDLVYLHTPVIVDNTLGQIISD